MLFDIDISDINKTHFKIDDFSQIHFLHKMLRLHRFLFKANVFECMTTKRNFSGGGGDMENNRSEYWLNRVGRREMVTFGLNGTPSYFDMPYHPCPAIRYKETTPEIRSLFEKQKGDWRLLTKEEKKTLYRANFCQTFEEFKQPIGDWKECWGWGLIMMSMSIWFYLFFRFFVYDDLPMSFKPSWQRAQLRRQIDLRMNRVRGLASEWDYEKNNWKRITWRTPPNPFVKCPDDED